MGIVPEDVAAVRAATDIVALIGEFAPLKRVGRRFVGLCPFHAEKTPSFSVNAEEGFYYCFGCKAAGDAISFLRAIEGCDFVEAVERLAERAGIAVRHDAGATSERDRLQPLKDAMARAVSFYHQRLLDGRDAGPARQYLRSRGYGGEVVRQFRLGWAPGGSQLVRALRVDTKLLESCGLARSGNYGPQDAFRERIVFPIFDPSGAAIALGGRVVPGGRDGGPKYRNSPETPIYSKRRTLYALNWARHDIVQTQEVIVCEGYTDVIGLFLAGLPRAVATCGTSLTEDHFKLLARFAKRVVLAFDADAAGQEAAARFYEWERRHDLEVAVAALPAGSDPGELASRDPDALRLAVEHAKPFLQFRLDRVLSPDRLKTPEARARAAEEAVAIVAEHPNELVRDQYAMTVADRSRIDAERIRDRVERARQQPQARDGHTGGAAGSPRLDLSRATDVAATMSSSRNGPGPVSPGTRAGRDALALAVHEPASMANRLVEALFADQVQLEAFRALWKSSSLAEAVDVAPDESADLLRQLIVSEPPTDADETLVALTRAAASRELAALERDARIAEAEGDQDRFSVVVASIGWLKQQLEAMDERNDEKPALLVTDAANQLLAWFSERGEVV